jgi:hypothetical protein
MAQEAAQHALVYGANIYLEHTELRAEAQRLSRTRIAQLGFDI